MSATQPMWRAVAVFRVGALVYAALLVAANVREYAHPPVAWLVLAAMAGWTVASIYGYATPRRRGWPLLVADLAVTVACLVASRWVVGPRGLNEGLPTLPVVWLAGPVLAWAVSGGRRRGVVAALIVGGTDLAVRRHFNQLTGAVLLLLTGLAVGHVARLAVDAQRQLQRAIELEAGTRERERVSRSIHDSVLQVLALVQRRGADLGGPAAELGRLAGEQEAALRALIGTGSGPAPAGVVDLRTGLGRYASPAVSLATPAHPVELPAGTAESVAAAVGAALDNVRRHCGVDALAWVLVEDEPAAVTVTVRDEGPGFPVGRLAEAAGEGRLGVAQSIQGRLRDLGGSATITSAPGAGTEVELRVPRRR